MKRIILLCAFTILCAPVGAEKKPKPWFKDWRFWTGRAISVGMASADAWSSVKCRDAVTPSGCFEQNPILGRGSRPNLGVMLAIGGITEIGETWLVVRTWKRNPKNGATLNWVFAGARGVGHGIAVSKNLKLTEELRNRHLE